MALRFYYNSLLMADFKDNPYTLLWFEKSLQKICETRKLDSYLQHPLPFLLLLLLFTFPFSPILSVLYLFPLLSIVLTFYIVRSSFSFKNSSFSHSHILQCPKVNTFSLSYLFSTYTFYFVPTPFFSIQYLFHCPISFLLYTFSHCPVSFLLIPSPQ